MGRSKKLSLTITQPVAEGMEILQERGQINYRSKNAAHLGLARYALMFPRKHSITEAIDQMHPDMQDVIDDFILEMTDRELNLGGTWLRHMVDRAMAKLPEPEAESIERITAQQILELAQRWQGGDETVWQEIAENK